MRAAAANADPIGPEGLKAVALEPARIAVAARYPDRAFAVTRSLELVADRRKAQFSTWYEMFPRSAALQPGRHGTLRDVEARLPYVAEWGSTFLYLPPVHPIGVVNRKGKNNALAALPDDVEVPGLLARPKAATRTSTRAWIAGGFSVPDAQGAAAWN